MPYYLYIMSNSAGTVLYTGVTNDLVRRADEHRSGLGGAFTSKYRATLLVYWEETMEVTSAIAREKQIKGGSRKKKLDLVRSMNPTWQDLYDSIVG